MAKFKIQDRVYDWDGDYTLAEAMLFFDHARIGMAELQQEMARGNPYVTVTLMYILKKRAGESVRWQDMQGYSVTDFRPVPDDDRPDSEGAIDDGEAGESTGERPDPTGADGTETPESATTNT